MSKKPRDQITINHLPGILLASMAECERWIAAGLIPVSERRTFRRGGRIVETRMFDPRSTSELCVGIIPRPARNNPSGASTWMQRTGTLAT